MAEQKNRCPILCKQRDSGQHIVRRRDELLLYQEYFPTWSTHFLYVNIIPFIRKDPVVTCHLLKGLSTLPLWGVIKHINFEGAHIETIAVPYNNGIVCSTLYKRSYSKCIVYSYVSVLTNWFYENLQLITQRYCSMFIFVLSCIPVHFAIFVKYR